MIDDQSNDLDEAEKEMRDYFKSVVWPPLEELVDPKLREIIEQKKEISNKIGEWSRDLEKKIDSLTEDFQKLASKTHIDSWKKELKEQNQSLVETSEANRASAYLDLIVRLDSAKQESGLHLETAFSNFSKSVSAEVETRFQDSKKMIRVAIILASISVALSLATILLILTNSKLL